MVYFPVTKLSSDEKAAFGEVLVTQPTPCFFLRFDYDAVNTEVIQTYTSGATGTVTQTNNKLRLLITNAFDYSSAFSKRVLPYCPGMGIDARFTARWSVTTAPNNDFHAYIGIGNNDSNYLVNDGYLIGFLSSAGSTSFGVFRISSGSVTAVFQSSFNVDKLDGTGRSGMNINLANLNVFRITVQYLGAGCITFQVVDPNTALWTTFHVIRYPNTATVPHTRAPSFKFCMSTYTSATLNPVFTFETASVGFYIQGKEFATLGILQSPESSKTIPGATVTNIITLQNRTTYNGRTNRAISYIRRLTASSDGTKPVIVRLHLNATVAGVPAFNNINTTNSIIAFDVAGTSVTLGKIIAVFALGKADDHDWDISNLLIFLNPGETLTFSATSTNTSDIFFSIILEDIL